MSIRQILEKRPLIVALAGPNGAGKSSFYGTYLRPAGLRFVNADLLAKELCIDAYRAAALADKFRYELFEQRESFIFETVFSDPVGDKLEFLKKAEAAGYSVVLFFIGVESAAISDERVAMRVSKGGHDVPRDKLAERYRILKNLQRALGELSNLQVYDNSDLKMPYRIVARREGGQKVEVFGPVPQWLRKLLSAK